MDKTTGGILGALGLALLTLGCVTYKKGSFYYKKIKKLDGTSIGLLGMRGAGKTSFLKILQGEKLSETYEATPPSSPFKKFTYKLNNGKEVLIAEGEDLSGGEYVIKAKYPKHIKEDDIVFFFFKANEYLQDREIRKMTNARLDFIYRRAKELGKELKNVVVIATHSDCLSDSKDVLNQILQKIGNVDYLEMLQDNFLAINATKKDDVNSLMEKLF